MGMYEARGGILPTTDLNQGDVLRNVVRPRLVMGIGVCPIRSKTKVDFKDKGGLERRDPELRAISGIDYLDHAIVLSASCDNARGTLPIILAPISAFKFKKETAHEQWMEVSTAATGTGAPRLFYLPANPETGMPRSEALLSDLFVLSHDLLQRCATEAGTTRMCGLNHEGVKHLQWALNLFYSRNPRDDFAWPSLEDFELKLAWERAALAIARERHEDEAAAAHEEMIRQILKAVGREEPAPQLEPVQAEQGAVAEEHPPESVITQPTPKPLGKDPD